MMTNNKLLGIAVWGIGEHAQRNILPAIKSSEVVKLIGITTRNKTVRREISMLWGCIAWEHPEQMLSSPEVDIVYIATPVALHFEQCINALHSGKHLWCEKLLTSTLEQTETIVELSKSKGLALCESLMYQYHPQYELVKNLLKTKEIGEIRSISARFGFPHLSQDNYRYDSEMGGGALTDAGVYPLSAALSLTEEFPEAISSFIEQQGVYEIDTFGTALLRFPSKIHFVAEWCFGCSYQNEIKIWGEYGLVTVERAFSKPPTYESKVLIHKDNVTLEKIVPPANHFVEMFHAFYKAVFSESDRKKFRNTSLNQARLVNKVRNL